MKRLSSISRAAMLGIIASAGVPIAAAMNHMFSPGRARQAPKAKSGTAPADREALAKAEAKRLRRAGRNKERA